MTFPAAPVTRFAILVVLLTLGSAVPGRAQDSRAAEVERAQADKATRLHPYVPTRAEGAVLRAQRALAGRPSGLYPWLGSIYSGGWMAAGPGLRMPFGEGGAVDAQAGISIKGYKLARTTLTLPQMANRRIGVGAQAQIIDATSVSFYGVGNDSDKNAKTTYHYRPTSFGAALAVVPAPRTHLRAGLDYLTFDNKPGRRGTSIEERFTDVPGLFVAGEYWITQLEAAYDWRDSPGYARRGGFYSLSWVNYDDRDRGTFGFHRVEADLRQMIPILRENWIIALRGLASTTSTDEGEIVPFFLMPQLGGGSELRGYPSWRFRDRHRLLMSAEYRWTPAHIVDMAIFHDAGKVAGRLSDLDLRDLHHSTGIGIRFHAPAATFLRFEVAKTSEGVGIVTTFGQSF